MLVHLNRRQSGRVDQFALDVVSENRSADLKILSELLGSDAQVVQQVRADHLGVAVHVEYLFHEHGTAGRSGVGGSLAVLRSLEFFAHDLSQQIL